MTFPNSATYNEMNSSPLMPGSFNENNLLAMQEYYDDGYEAYIAALQDINSENH